MRDFLALFPSFYLVDNVPYWVIFVLLFRWYHTDSFASHFFIAGGVALVISLLLRLLQGRPVLFFSRWLVKPLDDAETIQNIIVALVLIFPGLVGYDDIIELTGAPVDSERFLLGRVRSMILIDGLLVGMYACIVKWRDMLTQTANFQRRYTGSVLISQVANAMNPSWLLHMGIVMSVAILVDLFVHHPFYLSYPLAILLFTVTGIFSVFNTCWNNGVQKSYKES